MADGKPIAGSYIVVLNNQKGSKAQVHRSANSLTEAHGGKVRYYYAAALRGYAAAMSSAQAEQVAADPSVAYVEQDSVMRIDSTETNPPSWGLDRIDQRKLPLDARYTYSTTASNVTVYIIDSGIRTTNQDFDGRASVGFDNVGDGLDGEDCIGHGTHVAGTVGGAQYGVAKGVKLVSVRVIGCSGSGPTSGVIAGVDWVTANAVKRRVHGVPVERAECDHGRGHGYHRCPRELLELRQLRRHLRAGRGDHVRLVHLRHRRPDDQRHVDGGAARRRRGSAVPGRPPEG